MKTVFKVLTSITFTIVLVTSALAQKENPKVVITGVRFAYPLVEKWIKDYKAVTPGVDVVIETRTVTDPEKYDLLIEAIEHEKSVKEGREYISIGRYALLPIANSKSAFAKEFGEKGLNEKLYKQIFFHDVFAEKGEAIAPPFTIYTRLQKAGAPAAFAKYFGYEQQQIKGKAIAGADEHLIKALLKDETAISYTVPSLAFDLTSRKPAEGLTIIPVDLDGNGKVGKDERVFDNLDKVLTTLESQKVSNVPVEYIHFSIDKNSTNTEATKFLLWVASNADKDLHNFGYLLPEAKRIESEKHRLEKFSALK